MHVGLKKALFGTLPVAACLLFAPVASAHSRHIPHDRHISHHYNNHGHDYDRRQRRFHRHLMHAHKDLHRHLRRTQRRFYDYGNYDYGYRNYDRRYYDRRFNNGAYGRYRPGGYYDRYR